jgi:hypothetical protein
MSVAEIYEASSIKRQRRTKADMAVIRDAIIDVLNASHPQTVRQVFYQIVVRDLVPKDDGPKGYGTVQRLLSELRMAETAKQKQERRINQIIKLGWSRSDAKCCLPLESVRGEINLDSLSKERLEQLYARGKRRVQSIIDAPSISFNWIADNTRWMRKPTTFSSLEAAILETANFYRRDVWHDADVYVEIWCEKDALAGVILEETDPYDVPLMVARGFSSLTYLYDAARTITERGKPAFIYHFGDHDPSGRWAARKIEEKLREFAPEAEIHFECAAVTPEQIREWGLPTRPTKRDGNTHAKSFAGDSVELDAIPAPLLRQLVRRCIERHIDRDRFAVLEIAEQSERELLNAMAQTIRPTHTAPSIHDEINGVQDG